MTTEMNKISAPDIKASVIIIGFNGLKFIDDCLQSVLDQEIPLSNYEVILVDNASTDGMPEYVANKFPDVRVIKLNKNKGFNDACNIARVIGKKRQLDFRNGKKVNITEKEKKAIDLLNKRWYEVVTKQKK